MTPSADTVALVDFAPTLRLALLALLLALIPLAWVWLRQRSGAAGGGAAAAEVGARRLAALTAVTLFLTFDLIVFGSFTRLTDSGLGCPDWPGCYGEASPFGAREEIRAAEAALPSGPVTWSKAWIEMIHRYLAMMVGVLIMVMAAFAWREHWRSRRDAAGRTSGRASAALPISPWWPTATLVWVVVQGLFGKYTVTLKLYPAVVTLHLLGGIALLMLLAAQHSVFLRSPVPLAPQLRRAAAAVAVLLLAQIALGGWVSTNYAVLACTGFPQCNGQWWPKMDFAAGFTVLRELGKSGSGGYLSFEALVAIHWVHRAGALVATAAVLALAWAVWRAGGGLAGAQPAAGDRTLRRFAVGLALLAAAQVASGLSNVVLGWPIVAALAHSAGAAAMMLVLSLLLARSGGLASHAVRPRVAYSGVG